MGKGKYYQTKSVYWKFLLLHAVVYYGNLEPVL